jgi:hypothetical protein
MTADEWVECHDPAELLEALSNVSADERRWCYVTFCLRGVEADRAAELLGRRLAGEPQTDSDVDYVREVIYQARWTSGGGYSMGRKPVHLSPATQRARAAAAAFQPSAKAAAVAVTQETRHLLQRDQCEWLRCLFTNPFRPAAFAPAWRSETAVALASAIYAERAFDRLPILADALEEAGCDHADILAHCRGPGPHARGCWVVDGVLGKQ